MKDSSSQHQLRKWKQLATGGAVLAVAGGALGAVRYASQVGRTGGDAAVYTDVAKTFYAADDLLGWSAVGDTWVWLGLDLLAPLWLAALLSVVVAVYVRHVAANALPRRPMLSGVLSVGAILVGLAAPVPALWALASGLPPEGTLATVPHDIALDVEGVRGSFATGVDGVYTVVEGPSEVVAKVTAGNETFDVRFPSVTGSLAFEPTDLGAAVEARFSIQVEDLDAGIPLRSKHAKEYLSAEAHRVITFELSGLNEVWVDENGTTVGYEGHGALVFMGERLPLRIGGRVAQLDSEERSRLGLDSSEAYLLHGQLTLRIPETPLVASLGAFQSPEIPLSIRLVLALTPRAGETAAGL